MGSSTSSRPCFAERSDPVLPFDFLLRGFQIGEKAVQLLLAPVVPLRRLLVDGGGLARGGEDGVLLRGLQVTRGGELVRQALQLRLDGVELGEDVGGALHGGRGDRRA
jgi:hypothetical protein